MSNLGYNRVEEFWRKPMTHVTVDSALRDKLLGLGAEAELRDEQGRKLGRFVPEFDAALFAIPEIGLSAEELARRMAPDAKTYTTQEVLDYIRSRT
jgi:hypothetical protein